MRGATEPSPVETRDALFATGVGAKASDRLVGYALHLVRARFTSETFLMPGITYRAVILTIGRVPVSCRCSHVGD